MQIRISFMIFAMEILSLHWGNISVDIRIGDNLTDVYLKWCIVIWEKQAFSCCMHVLVMWGCMKEKVNAVEVQGHDDVINRIEVAAADFIPRQLVSIRGSIWCRCEACVQVEGAHFEHLLWLCTAHSVHWQVPTTQTEKYSKRSALKWRFKNATKGRAVRHMFRWREHTLNIYYDCVQHIQCTDRSSPHKQKSTQKEVLSSDDLKMLQRAEFASFIANTESNWLVMLKLIVSIF
jgi:hypothetical protein